MSKARQTWIAVILILVPVIIAIAVIVSYYVGSIIRSGVP